MIYLAVLLMSPYIWWVMMRLMYFTVFKKGKKADRRYASSIIGIFFVGFFWGVVLFINCF